MLPVLRPLPLWRASLLVRQTRLMTLPQGLLKTDRLQKLSVDLLPLQFYLTAHGQALLLLLPSASAWMYQLAEFCRFCMGLQTTFIRITYVKLFCAVKTAR